MSHVRWSRLSGLITPLLMICALACVTVGAFLWLVPVGWVVAGVALAFLAYVTDTEEKTG